MNRSLLQYQLALAAIFCVGLALLPTLPLLVGESLLDRVRSAPGVLAAAFQVAAPAMTAGVLIPLLGGLICLGAFAIGAVAKDGRTPARAVTTALVTVVALTCAAAILLRDIPVLAIALLPLALAVRTTKRLSGKK